MSYYCKQLNCTVTLNGQLILPISILLEWFSSLKTPASGGNLTDVLKRQ